MRNPWIIVGALILGSVLIGQTCDEADAHVRGDVNMDGQVTAVDAMLVLQDVAGLRVTSKATAVDGDTIRLTSGELVRYYSVDAPEPDEPGGQTASKVNARLIEDGVVLVAAPDGRDRDVYGRLLRLVYRPDGTWIERELVEGGHATWR